MLQRREPRDFWQSVTGSLEWDETPIQAAKRELCEETGIDAGDGLHDCHVERQYTILPAWRHRYAPENLVNTEHWFTLRLAGSSAITLNPDEHLAYQWLPAAKAAELATSVTNREAILECVTV